jgi:hypothetical protein
MRNPTPFFSATLAFAGFAFAAHAAGAADKAGSADKAAAGPPAIAWKDMTAKQKGKFMKDVVVPKFKPLFQEFDGKKFAKFECQTCHGEKAKELKFKMPTPGIHPLPGTPEAFQAKMKQEADWPKFVEFMKDKVTPTMATTLGLPAFDHTKPEAGGFGCQNCHTIEGKGEGKPAEKK